MGDTTSDGIAAEPVAALQDLASSIAGQLLIDNMSRLMGDDWS